MPIDCAQSHNGEYVGLWTGPDVPYPGDEQVHEQSTDGCETNVAAYLGLSQSALERRDLGWISWGGYRSQWALGDRTAHCYVLTPPDRPVATSLKGKA